MPVNAVSGSSAGTATKTPSNALDRNAFLKILAAQLQNQDPMQPMQDTEFIGQMAQFNALEQMSALNDGMTKLLQVEQGMTVSQALKFVGLQVKATLNGAPVAGSVSGVKVEEGTPYLLVGAFKVPLDAVTEARQPEPPAGGGGS